MIYKTLTQKIKERNSQKHRVEMWRFGKVTSSCSLVTSVMLLSEGRTLEVRKVSSSCSSNDTRYVTVTG